MTTNLVTEMVGEGMLANKQSAEREYEQARGRVERAKRDLAEAQVALVAARSARQRARIEYEDEVRSRRKPRQTNIVRRILDVIQPGNPATRAEIVERTGLDPTTVSSTLTRLRRAGFVEREGDFTGRWVASQDGITWAASNIAFPKEHRG